MLAPGGGHFASGSPSSPPAANSGLARNLKRQCSVEMPDAANGSDQESDSKTKKLRTGKISNESLLTALSTMVLQATKDTTMHGLELTEILPTFQRLTGKLLNYPERSAQLKTSDFVTVLLAKEIELDAKKQVIYFCRLFISPSRAQLSLTTAERSLNSFTTELYDTDLYVLAPESDLLEKEVLVHDHASLYNNPHLLPSRPLFCRYKYKHNGTLLLK